MKIASFFNKSSHLGICIIILTLTTITIFPIVGESLPFVVGTIALLAIITMWIMTGYEVIKIVIRKFPEYLHSPLKQWEKDRKAIGITCLALVSIMICLAYDDYIKTALALIFLVILVIVMGKAFILTIFDGIKAMIRKFRTYK